MPEALKFLEQLNAACSAALSATKGSSSATKLAASYVFVTELEAWRTVLKDRPEVWLFDTAHSEYLIGMLNAAQGQYRNAFKCLRLVLELHLQGVLLSTDLLELKEWLANSRDTTWASIVGADGVFGPRICKAFFPELAPHLDAVQSEAKTAYRSLSECIHGNVPVAIPLPEAIGFDQKSLDLWLGKASEVRRIVHFALTLRYLRDFGPEELRPLADIVPDVLGEIADVRKVFGGRVQ